MIYEFLADGFEEVEALTPYDMLLRAGADIKTVSLNRGKTVTGAHGVRIEADITLDEAGCRCASRRNAGGEEFKRV